MNQILQVIFLIVDVVGSVIVMLMMMMMPFFSSDHGIVSKTKTGT